MVLSRWGVDRDLDAMVDRLIRRSFGPERRPAVFYPTMDVRQTDGEVLVRLEVPGIDPEKDLDITVEAGVLTIEGEKQIEREGEEGRWYVAESVQGSFQRRISLPEGTNPDEIEAGYDAGVLTLRIPVPRQEERTRRIQVSSGDSERQPIEVESERTDRGGQGG